MLDQSNRFLSPREIVEQFGMNPSAQVADFGIVTGKQIGRAHV